MIGEQGNHMVGDESDYWKDKKQKPIICCYCGDEFESNQIRETQDGPACLKCLEEIEKESNNV